MRTRCTARYATRDEIRGTELGAFLERLQADIEEDRRALEDLMSRLDVSTDQLKLAAAWAGEKVGRLKLNGSLT